MNGKCKNSLQENHCALRLNAAWAHMPTEAARKVRPTDLSFKLP